MLLDDGLRQSLKVLIFEFLIPDQAGFIENLFDSSLLGISVKTLLEMLKSNFESVNKTIVQIL